MDFGSLDQAGFLRLLKRLQGEGGYASDDDSNRVKELDAVAKVAALVSETLEHGARNGFWAHAVELLSDYERLLYLPSDVGLGDAQRQERMRAFWRALPKMVKQRLDASFGRYLGAYSGTTERQTAAYAFDSHAASSAFGLSMVRKESASTASDRRLLDTVMDRGLPARALQRAVSTGAASYGSGSIDRKNVVTTPSVTPPTQTKAMVAPFEYGPGSVIDVNDWIEMQSMLMWKSKGFTLSTTALGRTIIASGSITNGSTAIIDGPTYGGAGAISWDNRFVQVHGVFSGSDVTYGGGLEDVARNVSWDQHVYSGIWKTGATSSPYSEALHKISDGSALSATLSIDASGNLTLTNSMGATSYFVLMIRCTPQYTAGSSTDTQPWVNTGDMVASEVTQLARSVEIRNCNGGGAGWTRKSLFGSDQGAMRRIFYTGPMGAPVGGTSHDRVVLDSSEDWRKRYVLIVPLWQWDSTVGTYTEYPTVNVDGFGSQASSAGSYYQMPRMLYTGTGTATDSSTWLSYQWGDMPYGGGRTPNVYVYADSATGALMAETKESGASHNEYTHLMFIAIATEQVDGGSVCTSVPLDTTHVHALDLNQIQNNGCYAQGMQGGVPRPYIGATTPGTAPTIPAMGLIAEGGTLPRRPVKWTVRERVGSADDSTYEYRQRLYGQRKRIVSVAIGAGVTIDLDDFDDPTAIFPGSKDQIDYRDRLIWVEAQYSTTDITISKTPQANVAGSIVGGTMYTGPYGDETIAMGSLVLKCKFSRAGVNKGYHSHLTLQNAGGSTLYVNMAVEVSPILGFTDRRLYGATP